MRKYRFGFLLVVTIGNMTRYLNLRKYAERDPEVECSWVTLDHHPGSTGHRLLDRVVALLPRTMALRTRLVLQVLAQLRRLARLEAVMLHLFEAEVLFALRRTFRRGPVLIASTDDAPVLEPDRYPLYPHQASVPRWRRALRLRLDRWRMRRFDGFVPFSRWGAELLRRACDVPGESVVPIHVGLDLDVWDADVAAAAAARPHGRPRLLFVGNDFERKGGRLLLSVYAKHLQDVADLHLVTAQAPASLPPGVHLHAGLKPNEPAIVALYASADLLVLPSTADLVPWSVLEAMAMALPVVATGVGAIAELVDDGSTGLIVPPNDEAALAAALLRLLADPGLRARMGTLGRARIEQDFDASVNVPRILAFMKARVDRRREASVDRGTSQRG